MGTDILLDIINEIFFAETDSLVSDYISMLNFKEVFNCQETLLKQVGVDIEPILSVVFGYGLYMLFLKFVWKGLNTHILGLDGDEDADPFVLIKNFAKAYIISISFGLLFSYILDIGSDIATDIMKATKLADVDMPTVVAAAQNTLNARLLLAFYVLMALYLQIKFVQNTVQLVFLRIGISFSVIGLLDSDGGVFRPYIKKFFQICFAVIVQVLAFKMSAYAALDLSFIWAFALLSMAIKAPEWLSEFIMVNQGGGGKLQSALYSFSILRSFSSTKTKG